MKALRSLLPLAVVLVIGAAVIAFLITREVVLGEWLLAFVLLGHGWVHVMFVLPRQEAAPAVAGGPEWPFDMGRSWVIGSGHLPVGRVRAVGLALTVVVLAVFAMAALSTVGLIVPAGWWPALVLIGATASLVQLALFFSPMLILGVAIDLVLLWVVLGSAWAPA